MKKINTFKIVVCLLVLIQSRNNNINAQNCKLDTFYRYNLEGNTYTQKPNFRTIYKYNSNKDALSDIFQIWIPQLNTYRNHSKIENEFSTQFLDKIVKQTSYTFDTINNVWINFNKQEYNYDASGNQVLNQFSEWNKTTQNWIKKRESMMVYNSNKQLISAIYQEFVGHINSLRNNYKNEYTFDANGNELSTTLYYWDTVSNSFIYSYRTTKTYNSNNKKLTEYYENWDKVANIWKPASKFTNTYNSEGLEEFYYYETWNETLGIWEFSTRSQKIYSSNQLLTTEFSDLWNKVSGTWEQNYKYNFSYNSNYDLENRTVNKWDKTFFVWVNYSKITHAYTPSGKISQTKEEDWIIPENNWRTISIENRVYNTGDSIILSEYQAWSNDFNALIKSAYTTHQYQQTNPFYVVENYRSYDNILEYYTRADRNEYHCASATTQINPVLKSNLLVFPNPVANGEIEFNITESTICQIFSTDGKLVKTSKIFPNQKLNVSDLKSGVYIIFLNQETKQLIIN